MIRNDYIRQKQLEEKASHSTSLRESLYKKQIKKMFDENERQTHQ